MGSGSSLVWNPGQDSVLEPGKQAVLTDPIEGLEPADVFTALSTYIRERPLNKMQFEVDRTLEELPDGGLHERLTVEVTGVAAMIAGDIKMSIHSVYRWKDSEFKHEFYFSDSTLKALATTSYVRALSDPFRLESAVDEYEVRYSGQVMQTLAKTRLAKLGYDVEVAADQDSLCGGGKSVLSAEIKDPELTTKTLWDKLSAQLVSDGTGAALDDGSVVVETAAGGMVSGCYLYEVENAAAGGAIDGATFMKWMFNDSEGLITCLDFGFDATLETVRVVTNWKVHAAPVRVEAWAVNIGGRRAGERVKKITENLLNDAFKFAEEKKSKQ